MASIHKQIVYFGNTGAKFWYDGEQLSSWYNHFYMDRCVPPSLRDNLSPTKIWATEYERSNTQCILAGTIGPTVLSYEEGYENRYIIYDGANFPPIIPGQYNDRTYPCNARISAIIPFIAPKEEFYGYGVKATIKLKIRKGLNLPINNSDEGKELHYIVKRCCYGPSDTFLRFGISNYSYDDKYEFGSYEHKSSTVTDWAGQVDGLQDGVLRLRQNNRVVPEYNGEFEEWIAEIDARGFVPERTYYLHLWGHNANFSNLIEVDLKNSCIEYEYVKSGISIYDIDKRRNAVPYVYNGTTWVRAEPHICIGEKWITCT